MTNGNGKIVVISGPSGVGKSTICAEVIKRTKAVLALSTTSRPQSPKEQQGREYNFVTKEEFEQMIENEEFLEFAEVFGNYYGTPKKQVEKLIDQGKTVILEIDVQGGELVKKIHPDAVMIFILPPTSEDLQGRINHRGRGEDTETMKKRLDKSGQETAAGWQFYDHMVINADLEQAIQEVISIIQN